MVNFPRQTIALIGAAIALLLLALLGWHEWRASESSGAAAKLATSQAGAAVASGSDAANTIGNRRDADAAVDRITQENDDAIHNAQGATAPVGAVGDAGIASLCKRNSYLGDPRCLHDATPR